MEESIGVVSIIDGLYCLKLNRANCKNMYSYCNHIPIFNNKSDFMGYLEVKELTHVFNSNYDSIFIYNPTRYCVQDALAYPLMKEE